MEKFDKGYEYDFRDEAEGDKNTAFSAKGIDGGEMLEAASPKTLLEQQLALEQSDVKTFWKSSFILFKLWTSGAFTRMDEKKTYSYTRDGFHEFLHDNKSQVSPDEVSRRMKVFRTYNKYDVSIIRLVEKAGVNKSYLAIPHVSDSDVMDILQFCVDTPYHKLRAGLQLTYPRNDGVRSRTQKSKETIRRENESRAIKTISDSQTGMLGYGDTAIFIPRRFHRESEQELKASMIFDTAMQRLGRINDRDAFWEKVVELVAKQWLTSEDMESIDQRLAATRAGDVARIARGLAA